MIDSKSDKYTLLGIGKLSASRQGIVT